MRFTSVALATLAISSCTFAHSPPSGPTGYGGLISTKGFNNATNGPSKGGSASCVSGLVTVNANTSNNLLFEFQLPSNQTEVTQTFVDYVTAGLNFPASITVGTQGAGGNFEIGATLCVPVGNTRPKGVQMLTHGVGFDRSYWDFAQGYSYVDAAAENGYASFFYDRLGVGLSSKPDAINVVQAPLEVEVAHQLATMLRNGKISGLSFSTVVGVGHSFGSIISEAITAEYPAAFDGVILTGFSTNFSAVNTFTAALNLALANKNDPARFANLSNGYLVSSTIISNQLCFFHFPGFDAAILEKAEATKGTATFGEFFSLGAVVAPAVNFTKPVAVVDGLEDLPFCSGNCSYPTDQTLGVKALYPNLASSNFGHLLVPNAGHGLNFHYTATNAYDYIQSFLKSHGLGEQ